MGKEAIETATKVAGIGAGAAVAIAAAVGAPVTITVALVGAGVGCISFCGTGRRSYNTFIAMTELCNSFGSS